MAKLRQKQHTLDEILSLLRDRLPKLREQYGITALGVFGSYLRGEQRKRSDLDVLVDFEESPSLLKFIEMENDLSDLIGLKVDLVPRKNLKPYIGKRILSEVIWLLDENGGATSVVAEGEADYDRREPGRPREYLDFLQDIVHAMDKAQQFVSGLTLQQLLDDERTVFALTHAIEIIGEAAKRIPPEVRRKYPDIPWKAMAAMRDKLAHGYFAVDPEKLWEVTTRLIPQIKPHVLKALEAETQR